MNELKIAFVLDHKLHHYRIPFFRGLSQKGYKIDIYHFGPFLNGVPEGIQQFVIPFKTPLKKLMYLSLPPLKDYNVVVFMQDLHIVNLWTTALSVNRKYKLIHWGIGVSSSKGLQTRGDLVSGARNYISSFADALVFYSAYPLQFLSEKNRKKSFIAHNTIQNDSAMDCSAYPKDSFLFIGTINNRKGLDVLVRAFHRYLKDRTAENEIRHLVIVGSGDNTVLSRIREYVQKERIESYVHFHKAVYDDAGKRKFFQSAVASVSPLQAGLSVLESFSYGVPFLTFTDAISGGEHLNVQDDHNGFLVNSEAELAEKMKIMANNRQKSAAMGSNAFTYYTEKRSMTLMVENFHQAIQYALDKKNAVH